MLRGQITTGSKSIFSGESKSNLDGPDGHQYVRHKTEEKLLSKCVKKSVKFGGVSVIVWGIFSMEGVGPCTFKW